MDILFRIIREETFNFKGGKLYLMLLREDGKFGVEIIDREKTFGRKFAKDRVEADYLFDIITKRLNTYKYLNVAEVAIRRCFERKTLNETMFLLVAEERINSQATLGRMMKKFKFETKAKVGFYRDSRMKGTITFYVLFDDIAIGRFFGTRFGKDFEFELI